RLFARHPREARPPRPPPPREGDPAAHLQDADRARRDRAPGVQLRRARARAPAARGPQRPRRQALGGPQGGEVVLSRATPVFDRADVDGFIREIRRGRPVKFACALAGIDPHTWRFWRRKGRNNACKARRGQEELDEYGLVWWEYQKARAAWAAARLDAIESSKKWEAHAWLLKTRFPGDFKEERNEGE